MDGNAALPWLYRQSLKNDVQRELIRETYATLEDLQAAAISTDDLLFSFKKQNQGERMASRKPDTRSRMTEPRQTTQPSSNDGTTGTGTDPNAMELDRLSTEEYRKRRAAGLCFKCGKKGLARDCPRHNEVNRTMSNRPQQGQYSRARPGQMAMIESVPEDMGNSDASLALVKTQGSNSSEKEPPTALSTDFTKQVPDFLHG